MEAGKSMAPNQRTLDDSQIVSPWGIAVRALSSTKRDTPRSLPKLAKGYRAPPAVKPRHKNGCEKLTDGQIAQICKIVLVRDQLLKKIDEEMSAHALAKKHGVCIRTITRTVRIHLNRGDVLRDGEEVA